MYQRAMDLILEIERPLDIEELRFGDFNYWPIIRNSIFQNLIQTHRVSVASAQGPKLSRETERKGTANSRPIFLVAEPETGLIHFDEVEARAALGTAGNNTDILFFCRSEEMDQVIEGKSFARFLDSLLEIARDRFEVAKVSDLVTTSFSQERLIPSLFVHTHYLIEKNLKDSAERLAGYEMLAEFVSKAGVSKLLLTKKNLVSYLEHISALALGYSATIEHFNPQAIVCSTYWHPHTYPLMLAAHRLGIPTVDIQHGRLGPHHGAYTQLTKVPDGGFAVVPDRIWCWGEKTKRDIELNMPTECAFHRGLVGGNPWLSRWPTTKSSSKIYNSLQRLIDAKEGRRAILLSLQPLEMPLTDMMLAAMTAAPKDWIWLVRLHPRQQHLVRKIAEVLDQHQVVYADLDLTRDLPLYAALEAADHHVTYYSTSAIDALGFRLRTTLLAGPGSEIFSSLIDEGLFTVAADASSVIEHIGAALAEPLDMPAANFIATEEGLAVRALEEITHPVS